VPGRAGTAAAVRRIPPADRGRILRLTSSFWVSAYLRRAFGEGQMAAVLKKGAAEAGAIFVRINRLDGTADLYGPAPQAAFDDTRPDERLFEHVGGRPLDEAEIDERLTREKRFDPDFWVVEIEARDGRHFLEIARG